MVSLSNHTLHDRKKKTSPQNCGGAEPPRISSVKGVACVTTSFPGLPQTSPSSHPQTPASPREARAGWARDFSLSLLGQSMTDNADLL